MSVRQKKNPAFFNNVAGRFAVIVVFFVLWIFVIGGQLVHLQVYQSDDLRGRAERQRQRERRTQPLRGSILDRDGVELAITMETQSLCADPTLIADVEKTAYSIAPLLGEKPQVLISKIKEAKANPKTQFMWLARELNKETADKLSVRIKESNLLGLDWRIEQKRFYPHQSLASHLVGYTNLDDHGQSGIEKTQDKELRGESNELITQRDGEGKVYDFNETANQPPRDVVLTIDYAIQSRVEQSLANGLETAKARAGTVVVMRPQTGEILAMASAPTFDPNKVGEAKPENLTNRTVQSLYEPGSTFKLVTYSAGLQEGIISPTAEIDCSPGFIKIGQRTINDSHKNGILSYTQALAKSSNVAAIRIAQQVGREKMFEYAKNFGYGEQTRIELPMETRGILHPADKWSENSLASTAIGYEIAVSTLQSAAAFATVANDGVRVQPHLIKEIRDSETHKVTFQANPDSRRVINSETAQTLRRMMQNVIEPGGTATKAHLIGYTAGGKTGTAHKLGETLQAKKDGTKSLYSKDVVASFVGFAPIENPQVVIAVMLDAPQVAANHGGDVAAPIFKDIAEQILPLLNVIPDADNQKNSVVAQNEVKKEVVPEKDKKQAKPAENKADKDVIADESDDNETAKSSAMTKKTELPTLKKDEKPAKDTAKEKSIGNEPRLRETASLSKPKPPPPTPNPKPKPTPQAASATFSKKGAKT